MTNKNGLIAYLTLYKDQLKAAPDDASFFKDLGQFMKTVASNPLVKPTIDKFTAEQKENKSKLEWANNERYQALKSILDKLTSNKQFPKDDIEITGIQKQFGDKEKGILLSRELSSQSAHFAVLKILERLDDLGLENLTDEWRVKDKDELIKYTISFDFQKFDDAYNAYLLEEESSAWGAYFDLITVPLTLYDFQEYLEETKDVRTGREAWTKINLVGIASEMKHILNGELAHNREHPYFFQRKLFYHHFLKVRSYLISSLEGLSQQIAQYDDAKATINISGLLSINEKELFVQYVGINGQFEHRYTAPIQDYVLLVALAKADGQKLTIATTFKILADPEKSHRPVSETVSSGQYEIVKAVRQVAMRRYGFTTDELFMNKRTGFIGLAPQPKKSKQASS